MVSLKRSLQSCSGSRSIKTRLHFPFERHVWRERIEISFLCGKQIHRFSRFLIHSQRAFTKVFLFIYFLFFQRPQCILDHHEVVTHISCCCSNHLAASSCYQVAQLAVRTVITLLWRWQMVWSITFQVQFQMVSTGFLPDRYMEWIRTWYLNRW